MQTVFGTGREPEAMHRPPALRSCPEVKPKLACEGSLLEEQNMVGHRCNTGDRWGPSYPQNCGANVGQKQKIK
jgi:hypothetical protein